ncbi:MAG: energy-coupled thiamine transporter ThiT, partial [Firmicutes bacterium]|nr:energy-coupled thiamine transporter ThiT [Bacillota bacterium]
MQKNNSTTKNIYCMALCAVLIALSISLNQIKIIPMPYGGSLTLFSMLAATLTGYFCGPKWGISSGIALGILNIIFDGYFLHPVQILL